MRPMTSRYLDTERERTRERERERERAREREERERKETARHFIRNEFSTYVAPYSLNYTS